MNDSNDPNYSPKFDSYTASRNDYAYNIDIKLKPFEICFIQKPTHSDVVCRLSRRKSLGSYPRSVRLLLSRFLAKTLRVNKLAMKKFLKKICRSEST